ncbi:MAG: hypothetical protein AAFQ12_08425 [Pseudomonadota bacterium]
MFKVLIALAYFVLGSGHATGQLSVDPAIVMFEESQDTRKDIKIRNTGTRVQYLNISAARIIEPGIYPETYFESPDPEQVGLLVAPRRIALQPNEERVVRVILLENVQENDKAWRVHIEPTIGDVQADKSVAITLLAFKALIIARPEYPTADLVGERNGRKLTLVNRGNSNLVLSDGQQCPADNTPCQPVRGKRLWPGLEWTTELPIDAPVTFSARGFGEAQTVEF